MDRNVTFWIENMSLEVSIITNTTENGLLNSTNDGNAVFNYFKYTFLCIIVFVGVPGNILTMIVMKSKRYSTTVSSLLLTSLAVSDTVLLMTLPFNETFIADWIGRDLKAIYDPTCKLYYVVHRTSKMTSSWFVVGLCIERFIAVWFPIKAKLIMTKLVVSTVIVMIFLIIFSFTGSWSYASKIVNEKCNPDVYDRKDTNEAVLFGAFLITGLALYSIVPIIILTVFTPLIIIKLVQHRRLRQAMSNTPVQSTNSDEGRVTLMLIGIVIAFIVLNLPMTVLHAIAYKMKIHAYNSHKNGFNVFKDVAQMLEKLNYALNFFMYMFTSKKFRTSLLQLLCRSSDAVIRQRLSTSFRITSTYQVQSIT